MIDRSTNIQAALRSRHQRGFLLNPFRFGPSVPTDPYWSNVILMLPLSSSLNDVSASGKTMTIAGTVTNTSEVTLFGNPVAKFGGGVSALLSSHADFGLLGNGPYTLEAWIYLLSNAQGGFGNLTASGEAFNGTSFWLTGGGSYRVRTGRSVVGSFNDVLGTGTFSTGAWSHIAFTHNGSTTDPNRMKLWVNGNLDAQGNAQFPVNLSQFAVGRAYPNDSSGGLDGYMSNVRVTKDIARYSAPFTPPSAPFPNS